MSPARRMAVRMSSSVIRCAGLDGIRVICTATAASVPASFAELGEHDSALAATVAAEQIPSPGAAPVMFANVPATTVWSRAFGAQPSVHIGKDGRDDH
jgi:hypothetical protein